ncbi:MAG TPA: hypothetical protein VF593_08155 [Chthoniobacteraceae bacterium]|jgi:hypothetical protein
MPTEPNPTLLGELHRACELLEARLKILSIETKKIAPDEWDVLPKAARSQIPDWLIDIHSTFGISNCQLVSQDPNTEYVVGFQFLGPSELMEGMQEGADYHTFLTNGILPLGYEGNGNLWVMRASQNLDNPIFLYKSSNWDGQLSHFSSAADFAASRLAILITSMEITDYSPEPSTELMWHAKDSDERVWKD